MFFARPLVAITGFMGLLALAGLAVGDANAQQIYRIVGRDGGITYSDTPPRESGPVAKSAGAPAPTSAGTDAGLPFELRQVSARYPVTLYTGPGCAPCASGRTLLSSRGIPFAEKTVSTNEDIEALKRIAGAPSLPVLAIGGQQLKGFSENEWIQFLDAAGYPKTSQLPTNYSAPPAAPLVVAEQVQAPPRPAPGAPAARPPTQAPADNPAGIRF
jgi:glutaredoxin